MTQPDPVRCKVADCGWHSGGTDNGAASMKCGGYASLDLDCLANFLSADPEDLDWDKYRAREAR